LCASYAQRDFVNVLLCHLHEIQDAFICLLSDPKSKHLTRESCCLGLAACRGLLQSQPGDDSESSQLLNNRLLRAFGQTTTFAGSALAETQWQAAQRRNANQSNMNGSSETVPVESSGLESEIGGAAGIGEAALGAYREMASVSVSLGRHDILYALLMLSISHSYWFTSDAKHLYR